MNGSSHLQTQYTYVLLLKVLPHLLFGLREVRCGLLSLGLKFNAGTTLIVSSLYLTFIV